MKKTQEIVGGHMAAGHGSGLKKVVPMLSMRTLIRSIPRHLAIWYLKTDMQGARLPVDLDGIA